MSLLLGNDWHVRTWLCNPAVVCEHPISINVASEHQYWRANWGGLGGVWLAGNLEFSKDAQRYSIPYAWCSLLWQGKQNVHNSCSQGPWGNPGGWWGLETKAWSCPCLVMPMVGSASQLELCRALHHIPSSHHCRLPSAIVKGGLEEGRTLLRIRAVTVPTSSVCLWLLKHLLDCRTQGFQEARTTAFPQEREEMGHCYRRQIGS